MAGTDPAGSHRLQRSGGNTTAHGPTDEDAHFKHAARIHRDHRFALHAPADTYSRYAYSNT